MKPSTILVERNVKSFIHDLDQHSVQVSSFYSNCLKIFNKHRVSSPLEQMFYAALQALIEFNSLACYGPSSLTINENRYQYIDGIKIVPQQLIGRFRVDFKLTFYDKSLKSPLGWLHGSSNELVIEIDSKSFHDRSESDRIHEKKRGRYLVSKRYKILRYTGSEVFKDPLGKATEALEILANRRLKRIEFHQYDDMAI